MGDEGKRRTDFSRSEFIAKVQAFKDEYEARITDQLKAMGSSCDWDRQRFTMDPVCARAVREAFFRLFKDGLIYRGKRLVNWDPITQTALADDEVEMQEVDGAFYYLRYPLAHPSTNPSDPRDVQPVTWSELSARGYPVPEGPGFGDDDRAWVTVATTRPETYLGDAAVALNPKDLRAGALRGLNVELPIVGRPIPIIEDDYVVMADPDSSDAKAKMATGFLKVTPAHDPNDWEIGRRHDLAVINVMAPDASISDQDGWYDIGDAHIFVGKSREDARKLVIREFEARGLLEETRPYRHSVGHSYRSHAPIEPYLSDQWYVKVTDPKLRGYAQRALALDQRTSDTFKPRSTGDGDGALRFYPDRYAKTYETWHDNLRDWCISRQLWWGHQIPVWRASEARERPLEIDELAEIAEFIEPVLKWQTEGRMWWQYRGEVVPLERVEKRNLDLRAVWFCVRDPDGHDQDIVEFLEAHGLERDPDVLDTWFSSALWPLNTMGWPEPPPEMEGLLEAFNPTSVLCTAREIITLWVSRMVMFNRYFLGDDDSPGRLPFADVFIHAMIQDGDGRKMSKSLGNGVDPLDIIHSHGTDAMRFTLCHMTTQTQDVRMPVETDAETGRNTSPKFDIGRNYCNKLWNASRFTVMMLEEATSSSEAPAEAGSLVDKWMLSRLARAIDSIDGSLAGYEFSVYAQTMYDLLWRDFCDWYLEGVKPTVKDDPAQQAVLRSTLDAILRLLHPIAPFITEVISEQLSDLRCGAVEGLELAPPRKGGLLCTAGWPDAAGLIDAEAEARFGRVQELVTAIREVRAQHRVAPKRRITLHTSADLGEEERALVRTLAGVEQIIDGSGDDTVAFNAIGSEHGLSDLADEVDSGAERERLERQLGELDKSIGALEGRLIRPAPSMRRR